MFLQEAYTNNHMKRYVPIIIGVVALCAVLYLGSGGSTSDEEKLANEESSVEVTSKSFQGSLTKMFEGEHTLMYGLDLPETATATVSMDGALVKVSDSDMPVLAMYVSFEGGRGYSATDYITNNIIPKVSGVTIIEPKTVGEYEWTVAQSANSEWHVTSVENGKWLLVVENKKADSEKAMTVLETVVVSTPDSLSQEETQEETSSADEMPVEKVEVSEESKTEGK